MKRLKSRFFLNNSPKIPQNHLLFFSTVAIIQLLVEFSCKVTSTYDRLLITTKYRRCQQNWKIENEKQRRNES